MSMRCVAEEKIFPDCTCDCSLLYMSSIVADEKENLLNILYKVYSGEISFSRDGMLIIVQSPFVVETLSAAFSIALLKTLAASLILFAVLAMSLSAEGLMERISGMRLRRILFRVTSSMRLVLSVTKSCPLSFRYFSMSALETQSIGRRMNPFLGAMPVRPFMPVPRIRLMSSVSTESSR